MPANREREERPVLAVQEALYWLGDAIGRPGYAIVRLGERVADLGHTWSAWWCERWERREEARRAA